MTIRHEKVALKDLPKNRDVMTPLGVPRWVMLMVAREKVEYYKANPPPATAGRQ